MKRMLVLLTLTLVACGQKNEKYEWTVEEAVSVMTAQRQYAVAQQAAEIAKAQYFAEIEKVHKDHRWPDDVKFDGQKWIKQPVSTTEPTIPPPQQKEKKK